MKSVLIFSNPFGYGPSGKAISIAKYIAGHTTDTEIIICGSRSLLGIAGDDFRCIEMDDRNGESIIKALKGVSGSRYIISSQNRFAIRVAKKLNIPCAFLDGLAWFWREIPEEHFWADIVFWINYSQVAEKIPQDQRGKVVVVNGITETVAASQSARRGVVFYLGGCKNPLAPVPTNYLDLVANLLNQSPARDRINIISMDHASQKYLIKHSALAEKIKIFDHSEFIRKIANCELFISNGGQTASMEAASVDTPTSFFLPINLSQASLIKRVLSEDEGHPSLRWDKYFKLPRDFFYFQNSRHWNISTDYREIS
jgi:hypothetical protein